MSRFFRSADSTSSSTSESGSGSGSEDELDTFDRVDGPTATNEQDRPAYVEEAVPRQRVSLNAKNAFVDSRPAVQDHRDLLLHALLEERCLNETLASPENLQQKRDSPDVQAHARAKYQRISAQLASLNLISSGLESDKHATTRQKYRAGLDVLSRSTSTAVPLRLRRLLTDSDAEIDTHRAAENEKFATSDHDVLHRQPPALPYPLRRLITGTETIEPQHHVYQSYAGTSTFRNNSHIIHETVSDSHFAMGRSGFLQPRYRQDFEEVGLLGKGGYGVVYRVRHRLDNQSYAVKKVPLSAMRLKRIQEVGQSEVDAVLRELRTLARLEHPNIVRYHNSWIEWTDTASTNGFTAGESGVLSTASEDAILGAQDESKPDLSTRVATTSESEHVNILFEHSRRDLSPASSEATASTHSNDAHRSHSGKTYMLATRNDVNDRSTIGMISGSNIAVEPIQGDADETSREKPPFHQDFNQPTLVLHMQMSLHPMTLAEYMSPNAVSSNPADPPPISHCFHLQPSVAILQAILDGMEYLHDKGLVHRDIKPANIFIGIKGGPETAHGVLCADCQAKHKATAIQLDVRIGDFGLVALGRAPGFDPSTLRAAGTELYRPAASATSRTSTAALDIYALGIVAFELLWRFDTRMERLHVIKRLKEGEFPEDFASRLGNHGENVVRCIKSMISPHGTDLSTKDIKKVLADLQKTFH